MTRKLFKWFKILLIVYATTGIALYYLQEKILFHPTSLSQDYSYHFEQNYNEVNIQYDSTTQFNIIQFAVPVDKFPSSHPTDTLLKKNSKGVVLYFHGNKENISRYAHFANNFTKNNYEVWMIDYPTFGKSTGKLSEEILYQEALQFYKLANAKYNAQNIIIYGKSLGTGIAAQLASTKKCKQLILETPYYSMVSLVELYTWMYPVEKMFKYKIPTNEYLKNISVPITIFHGTADELIPYSNASKLKMVIKPTDEFITIEKGTHHNLNDFVLFHSKLDSLLH
ncbi:MAG: alpha/beta fold hydrolase [Chitinophagaceae bacterium]|nr:alpha/beta fold hydrolase [Chitinophagaceae bacterium]